MERFWTRWPDVYRGHFNQPLPEVILKRGHDFDFVVFGIGIGSLPYLCLELLEVSSALRDTNQYVGRVPSSQFQLYTDVARQEIESEHYKPIVDPKDVNVDYMSSGADANLMHENWEPLGVNPQTCEYHVFMKNIKLFHEIEKDPDYPCEEIGKAYAFSKMQDIYTDFWPSAIKNDEFDWDILTDPENRTGADRFNAQYFHCNVNPSELYPQILANTSRHRITTDGAGFDNIYFTGDWIENGFNCCVEAAVTAGLLTSKALSGYPKEIFWEQFAKRHN